MTLNEWIKANGDKEVVFEEDGKFSIKESEPEKCYRWEPNKYDNYWFITHSGQSEKIAGTTTMLTIFVVRLGMCSKLKTKRKTISSD